MAVVVILAFVLLTAVFRSLLIPLVASALNLLSVVAALGAITAGQAHSTRIVAAAAGIMILVFGSFLPGGHHLLQELGFGLGFSVLVDAVIIRSVLLPAAMHLIGPANWYLPARLGRVLPRLDIEAAETGSPGETVETNAVTQ